MRLEVGACVRFAHDIEANGEVQIRAGEVGRIVASRAATCDIAFGDARFLVLRWDDVRRAEKPN